MKKEFNSLNLAHSKFEGAVGSMEEAMVDKIEFEFSITWVSGDGFCVLNVGEEALSPLEDCMNAIKNKGILTADDHVALAI